MYSRSIWINSPEQVEMSRMTSQESGYSIYRIRFKDGAAYVGISEDVVERIKQHFTSEKGSRAVYERFSAGEEFQFEVLSSGLTEDQAREDEKVLIKSLPHPLNEILYTESD